jgi:hypothetical protein
MAACDDADDIFNAGLPISNNIRVNVSIQDYNRGSEDVSLVAIKSVGDQSLVTFPEKVKK